LVALARCIALAYSHRLFVLVAALLGGSAACSRDANLRKARLVDCNSAVPAHNQLSLVRALLAVGADPTAHNDRNISVLMIACGRGYALMVDSLIAAGASVTAEDNMRRTPMKHAQFFAREEIRARSRKAGARR